jgi:hypothetical protein
MTDPTPPPGHEPDAVGPTDELDELDKLEALADLDPIDEAASAALDGEPFEPDAALDADLVAARVDELADVRARLGAPVAPPDPDVVDAHIAAALADLTDLTEPSTDSADAGEADAREGDGSVAPVVPLGSRRRRSTAGRWLAVAAAVAVVALAIPVVRSLTDRTSSNDTASVASADTSSTTGGDAAAMESTGSQAFSSTTLSAVAPGGTTTDQGQAAGDIGQADDPVELAALVRQHAPDPTDQSTTQSTSSTVATDPAASTATTTPLTRSASPPACDAEARAQHPGLGALRYAATATYQSIPVSVAVYEVPDPTTVTYRLMVNRLDTCAVLLDLPYP